MNEEIKQKISNTLKGRKLTEERRNNIRLGLKQWGLTRRNKNHHNWKGDNVGYGGLHDYIKYYLPKPNKCQMCFEEKILDLANKGIYNRDFDNWTWLCRSCHWRLDGRINNIIKSRKVDANPT